MHVIRILPDRTLNLYQDGRLNSLLLGFKNAVDRHNTSVVIVVDGRSGLGKTTLANQVAITLDPNFSLKKIHYDPTTFLEGSDDKVGLANAKPGDCIVFDEAMLISNRAVLSEINRAVILAMSMIRSKRIYVIFCVNSLFDLDKNLAISRADILLHVYGQTLIDRGRFGAFFKGKDGIDRLKKLYLIGKKFYDYAKPKCNFIGRFTKEFVVDEETYEIQKQIGVNNFLRKSEGRQTRAMKQRNLLICYMIRSKGMTVPELMDKTKLCKTEIYKILSENPEE